MRYEEHKNKQLSNTRVLKVKSSPLEMEKSFKMINISIIDMDKFEKRRTVKEWNICIKILATIGTIV